MYDLLTELATLNRKHLNSVLGVLDLEQPRVFIKSTLFFVVKPLLTLADITAGHASCILSEL